jgi:hypothetical protein
VADRHLRCPVQPPRHPDRARRPGAPRGVPGGGGAVPGSACVDAGVLLRHERGADVGGDRGVPGAPLRAARRGRPPGGVGSLGFQTSPSPPAFAGGCSVSVATTSGSPGFVLSRAAPIMGAHSLFWP